METPREAAPRKPASLYWVFFLAFATTATNLGLKGGGIINPIADPVGVLAVVGSTTFLGFYLLKPKHRLTYAIGVVCVALFPIRLLQSLVGILSILGQGEHIRPSSLEIPMAVLGLVVLCLFVLLFWKFTFGAKSQAYFEFPAKNAVTDEEPSP